MTKQEAILKNLYNDSRFTLTGSRYWNKIDPIKIIIFRDTDYDFVAEYSEELVEEFKNIGFISKNAEWSNGKSGRSKRYSDADTKIVLYFGTIQLILKENVQRYIDLQNILTPEFYIAFLWKRHLPISYIQATLNNLLRTPPV